MRFSLFTLHTLIPKKEQLTGGIKNWKLRFPSFFKAGISSHLREEESSTFMASDDHQ